MRAFPFDAVLFDLDGTLVATDRFWPDAARAGARLAFEELGLERRLPSPREWMALVGRPLAEGFAELFPDLEPAQRKHLLERCVEAEHRLLAEGRAGTLPGVIETLETLSEAGVGLAIASNCSRSYLEAMLGELGLERWIGEARCLDSPGIDDKADMIEDLLLTLGTRRAVFVGDRIGDRDAAWANGLPHVHLARGYAPGMERVEAEAVIEGMDSLLPRLQERARWVDSLAALAGEGELLGITGGPGSGKTLLAEELAERGLEVREGEGLTTAETPLLLDLAVPEALLRRRLEGRDLRSGGAAEREEIERRLAAHRLRGPLEGARVIPAANLLGEAPLELSGGTSGLVSEGGSELN